MATTGIAKYRKYFSNGDVKTKIKKNVGFVNVYDSLKNIIDQIEEGSEITVSQDDYNPRYKIFYNDNKEGYVSSSYIEKPKKEKGATESLKIYTSSLINLGEEYELEWNSKKIKTKRFSSKKILLESAIHGIFDNHYITEELKEDLFSLLKDEKKIIHWNACNDINELNEVGKYLSEIMFALYSFNDYTEVHFPISSNSKIIDSFLVKNDNILPISNKYGKGAKSSLFNIFEYFNFKDESEISEFYQTFINSSSSRNSVYNHCIQKYLNKKYDSDHIFESIIKNLPSNEKDDIVNFIKNTSQNKKIINCLPYSITAFFCRKVAKKINQCDKSISLIKRIFRELNVKQLTLDNKSWKNGVVNFSLTNMDNVEFVIRGDKSAINNPYASHGLLNYEIKNV